MRDERLFGLGEDGVSGKPSWDCLAISLAANRFDRRVDRVGILDDDLL